jgi:hypothetical protein
MTYDERIFVLIGELAKILEGYATPKHLNTRAKEEDEARNIVRMLNQKFPNDTTEDHIRGTMDRAMLKLKEAHKSRTWPTAADISAAVSKSMTSASTRTVSGGPWKPDTLKINAARIKNGEPVSETYIRGTMAQKLLDLGMITEAHLQPYLEYLSHNKVLDRI